MAKTTFKVRRKRWAFFNKECEALLIKRDAFINKVLDEEISLLRDISPCDDIGAKWLKENWIICSFLLHQQDIEIESVAITLSENTIKLLNAVCEDKKIPRDAFFNLMLEFLSLRIFDAAWTIKSPRGQRDFIGDFAYCLREAALYKSEQNKIVEDWIKDLITTFRKKNSLLFELLNSNLYDRLTVTKEEVYDTTNFGSLSIEDM